MVNRRQIFSNGMAVSSETSSLRRFLSSPWAFMLPAIILTVVVLAYPMVSQILGSFYSEPRLNAPSTFIGLDNYRRVISDPIFGTAVLNTAIWTIATTICQVALGFGVALLLNQQFAGRRYARSMALFPWVVPGVVAAIAWRFLLQPDFGAFNNFLRSIGLGDLAQAWLSDPQFALAGAISLGVWKGFGFYALMFLAGLQSVPQDQVEAARTDGANGWQVIRSVVLPHLRGVTLVATLLGLVWTANYFDAIYALTQGGPARQSETLAIYVYNTAFQFQNLRLGMAAAVVMMVVVGVAAAIYVAGYARLSRPDEGLL